jgi:uncharacterized protein (DUF1778 family)
MTAPVSKAKRSFEMPEERRSFVLAKKQWDEFLKILGRPPRIKRKLARLLAERSVPE